MMKLFAALAALMLAFSLFASSAPAQTPDPQCDPAVSQSAPRTLVRHGSLPVCSSAVTAEVTLTHCTYTIDGRSLRVDRPVPKAKYLIDVSWIRRGMDYPYTAQCFSDAGDSEVAQGVARFPEAPAAPVTLP